MKSNRFEVLSQEEVKKIHSSSMDILADVGIQVSYSPARELFRKAGAIVEDDSQAVKITEDLIQWALEQAPDQFWLYGNDVDFRLKIGGDQESPVFAGLGAPTRIIDLSTDEARLVTH